MPGKQSSQAQTSKQGNMWWVPLVIGFMMLMIPGGLYASPVMFLLAVVMKLRRPKKNPQTSPSLITLINIHL